MKDIIISLYMWFLMLFVSTIFIPWSLFSLVVFPLFDWKRKQFLMIHRAWCNSVAWGFPKWKYVHHGFDKLRKGQHYVVMSNHQSMADILLLSFLPITFRWTTKTTVFYVPIFGWQFWMGGHLGIVRGSEKSRKKFMARALKTLRDGISILIFPEGTRSKTGEIGPFKRGGFLMAVRTGTPILPIVISGSGDALPKHSWIMKKNTYPVIKVLDPIQTQGMTEDDVDGLMKRLRDLLIEEKKATDEESRRLLAGWIGRSGS
jgi:1-acyl-sn-glycerol-3-phosphate acyltransferase